MGCGGKFPPRHLEAELNPLMFCVIWQCVYRDPQLHGNELILAQTQDLQNPAIPGGDQQGFILLFRRKVDST